MKILNIKTSLVALFAVAMCANVSAQEKRGAQYLTNGFWDNWFISAGAGAQTYWGNTWATKAGTTKFEDRMSMTYNLALGKWMTPSTGLRIQGVFSPEAVAYGKDVDMNILNIHADVLFNLANSFGGYRADRVYSPILFIGAGYGQNKIDSEKQHSFTGNVGLLNAFRVSKHVDINLELGAMFVPRSFDGFIRSTAPGSEDFKMDASFQASVGITYRFGAKGFEKYVKVPEVDLTPYNNKIKELVGEVNSANAKAAELNKKVAELQNVEPVVVVAVEEPKMVMPAISTFFNIGSSVVGPKDMVQLEEIANIIKQTPETMYKISGLIDFTSGSKALNENLCKARIEAVYNTLVKFGVNAKQLVKVDGSPASPSNNPILNRGAVVSPIK